MQENEKSSHQILPSDVLEKLRDSLLYMCERCELNPQDSLDIYIDNKLITSFRRTD